MATTPDEKARAEELRKVYSDLVALPADEGRRVAVKQQSFFMERLKQYRDKLGGFFGRWKEFDEDANAIAQHIAWGDELSAKTDEESRKQRRQQYARAYIRGRTATRNLDREIADGSSFEVAIRDVVADVAKTTEKVVDKVAKTVDEVAQGVSTGSALALLGLVVAVVAYANQKGKR